MSRKIPAESPREAPWVAESPLDAIFMQEQQVNEEFDTARASYQVRREAGAVRYVSHEEAGRRLGMPSG